MPSAVKAQSAPSSSKVVVVSSVDVLGVDKMTVTVANGRTNRASRSSTTNKSMLANNNNSSSSAYFLRHRFYQNPYQNVQQQKNNSSTPIITNNNMTNVRSLATRKLPTVVSLLAFGINIRTIFIHFIDLVRFISFYRLYSLFS